MAPLVVVLLFARRTARAAVPLGIAAALAGVVVLEAIEPLTLPWAIAAWVVLLGAFVQRARRRAGAIEASAWVDLEVGALAMVGAFAAVVRLDRSLDDRTYPLVYVCLALTSAFARPAAALGTTALAIGLEVALRMVAWGDLAPQRLAPHVLFMAAFAIMNTVMLRGEIARIRKASQAHVAAEIERLRDDARGFRLMGAPDNQRPSVRPADEERLVRSGVEEIHEAVLLALRLLQQALGLHTAMLLWQNDSGTHLRISELASDAQNLSEGPFLATEGIFGAATSQRSAVRIAGLKPGYRLPYYAGVCPVRAVLALPVLEHGTVRGLLVVDRLDDRPLDAREEALVEEAARYAVRAIQNERVFVQLERAKVEQGKLYRAAETLSAARTETEVIDAGVRSAREITAVDFAAVTLFDEVGKVHEIRAASGAGATEIAGQRFRHNGGLVSMVLENRHSLPYRGEYDERRQIVFTRRIAPPQVPSLLVLPLLVHDRPLGTLVLGSRRRGAFGDSAKSTLEVLASHMAVSLSGARMVRRLEELATLDGLTGLFNKRAILEIAEQKIAASRRFGRQLAVLVADIDHFKRVNDTWGHDTGDVIIKGLGNVLRQAKRSTDAVGRFGGEEFVLVCEETDARGAHLLAERIREELERTTFHHESGPVHVTCSVGIATFPDAGERWDTLFKAADEALYVSKRAGRNRTTTWTPASVGSRARSA